MNSIAPSHLQQEPPFTWWLCQLRFYQALISCANHRLNAQQGPRLKDDVPAAVATNRCVGYEIAMMDERRIFIENKAATMDLEELAPIKSGIDRQAEELKGKRQQFVKDTEKRWPPAVEQLRRIAWFYIAHSFAKSISTAIEEIHDKSSSAPTHPRGAKSPTRSLRRWWGSSTDSSSTWPGTGNSTSRPTPQPIASAPRVGPHRTGCPDMPIINSGHIAAEAPSSRREWLPKAMTAAPNTASSPPALSRQQRCGLPQRRESTLGCCGGRAFGRAPLAPRSQMGRSNRSWTTAAAYAVMRRRSLAGAGRNVNCRPVPGREGVSPGGTPWRPAPGCPKRRGPRPHRPGRDCSLAIKPQFILLE